MKGRERTKKDSVRDLPKNTSGAGKEKKQEKVI